MQSNGVPVVRLTWDRFDSAIINLADHLRASIDPHRIVPGIYGEPRGGLILAVALSHLTRLPLLTEPEEGMVWADDIVDSGCTAERIVSQLRPSICVAWVWSAKAMARIEGRLNAPLCLAEQLKSDGWYVFPWEDAHQAQRECREYRAQQRRR